MATVKLRVSDKVLDKFLKLLKQFDSEEVKVIEETAEFTEQRERLYKQAYRLENGEAKTYSVEEADAIFEKTIRKHEG
jgi:tyrosyl-tRNA synthetase